MLKIKKIVSAFLCTVITLSIGVVALADEPTNTLENTAVTTTETTTSVTPETTPKAETATPAPIEETVPTPEPVVVTPEPATPTPEPVVATPEPTTTVIPYSGVTPTLSDYESTVIVNGKTIAFDDVGLKAAETTSGSVTFVPIRKLAEMLNCTVAWRGSDRTVHIFKNGRSVMFTIDNPEIVIHNFEVGSKFIYTTEAKKQYVVDTDMNIYPVVFDDRTLLPVRAAAEILGSTVDFNGEAKTITITETQDMQNYVPTIADIKARNYIETYNYVPEVKLAANSIVETKPEVIPETNTEVAPETSSEVTTKTTEEKLTDVAAQ